MSKQKNIHDLPELKKNICPVSGLPVVSLPEFDDVHIKGDYYTPMKKVGDSIVHIQSRGDFKNFDMDEFNTIIEKFCCATGVKKPYVHIIDLKNVTGRLSLNTIKKQMRFFYENQDTLIAVVYIDNPSWFKPFIKQGLRLFNPTFKVVTVDNYADAVSAAQRILDGKTRNLPRGSVFMADKPLSFKDVVFKPEWVYNNTETGFRYKAGAIPESLLYLSLHGNISQSDDVENTGLLVKKVMELNNLTGISYILADFSEFTDVKTLRLRQQLIKEMRKVNAETNNFKATFILINPSRFNKIAANVFAPFLKQKIIIVDTVDEAFEKINDLSGNFETDSTKRDIQVSAADLEELSNAFGLLQWSESEAIPEAKISPDNPLAYLIESLELVKSDLNEMRENEKRIQEERLQEYEDSRKQLLELNEEAENAKKRLQTVSDNMLDLVSLTDLEGNYKFAGASHKILGYDVESLIGTNVMDYVHPDDLPEVQVAFADFVNNIKPKAEAIYRYRCADGSYLWFETIGTFILDEAGEPTEIIFNTRDITESKQAEETLHLQGLVLDQIKDFVTITDLNGVITFVNKAELEASGRAEHEIIGQPTIVYGEEPGQGVSQQEILIETLQKGAWRGEVVNYSADGRKLILDCRTQLIYNKQGKPIAICGISTDVTERKQVEQELITAKEKAEESDRLKSAFLANMSHEIRTPLNGILGFTDMLNEPNLEYDKQKEYIKIIQKSGSRLLNTVNNIIDISKIEAGLMEVYTEQVNINEQIQDVYIFFKKEAEAKGLTLSFNNSLPAEKSIIKTDREKLYAIISNLVKNAIKFTDEGEIELGYEIVDDHAAVETHDRASLPHDDRASLPHDDRASLPHDDRASLPHDDRASLPHDDRASLPHDDRASLPHDDRASLPHDDRASVQFYVKDTGTGIPKDRHEAIFKHFVQADITNKKAYQGSGLGLSISKAYAEMLGGSIRVESEKGKGSVFYFTLPCSLESMEKEIVKDELPAEKTEDQTADLNLKILIAEDEIISEMVIKKMVSRYSKETLIARNGSEAVDMCRQHPDIDLVLMDMQMPEMDGYEATRQIRQSNENIVLIAQTAYGFKDDREKALADGCNDYISKPIDKSKLNEIIVKYFGK